MSQATPNVAIRNDRLPSCAAVPRKKRSFPRTGQGEGFRRFKSSYWIDRTLFDQPRRARGNDCLQQGHLVASDAHMIAAKGDDGLWSRRGLAQAGARGLRDQRVVLSLQYQELAG